MKPNILTEKKKFNPLGSIIQAVRHTPKNLNAVFNSIVYYDLVKDNFYVISDKNRNPYYKNNLKKSIQSLNSYLDVVLKKDKDIFENPNDAFEDLTDQTNQIICEEEILTTNIALLRIPNNEILNELSIKFNSDRKFISSIVAKVIKDDKNKKELILTSEERNILRLMEYSVNLIFLREFTNQVQYHTYDVAKIKNLIDQVLKNLENILKTKSSLFFKEEENTTLFYRYKKIANFLKETNVQQRTSLSQIIDAWRLNPKAIEGTLK